MKILLLGASGQTGKILCEMLLEAGHHVHALVRNPNIFRQPHENLRIFKGSPINQGDVSKALTGCDAAVSTLNVSLASGFPWSKLASPKDLMSLSVSNLIAAMTEQNVQRMIIMSSSGAGETRSEPPLAFRFLIAVSNLKHVFADHNRQEAIVKNSDLDWTIVRPVGLQNRKQKSQIQVSFNSKPAPATFIPRSNVADFIRACLENGSYLHQAPTISAP